MNPNRKRKRRACRRARESRPYCYTRWVPVTQTVWHMSITFVPRDLPPPPGAA